MLYLYALGAEVGDLSDLRGVGEEPLLLVPVGGAVAIGGTLDAAPAVTAMTLRAQDALVRALHARAAALLPMRFGTAAADAADARHLVDVRHDLVARLARVRGCEQMIVRVLGAAHAPADTGAGARSPSGTDYLRARARSSRQVAPELAAIADAPGAIARDVRVDPAHQPGLLGSVYHLIGRGEQNRYRTLIDDAAARLAGVHVFITGPGPAYAFA